MFRCESANEHGGEQKIVAHGITRETHGQQKYEQCSKNTKGKGPSMCAHMLPFLARAQPRANVSSVY